MNKPLINTVFIAVFALMSASCMKETGAVLRLPGHEGKEVTVSMGLSVSDPCQGTVLTKSVDDPADFITTEIHNLCILQYGGTGDDATLRGGVHYLVDDADPTDPDYEEKCLNYDKIKLVESNDSLHTLVVLANTYEKIAGVNTLGEMLHLIREAGREVDLFGYNGDGSGFPEDTDYCQRMNGLAVTKVTGDTHIDVTLRRSMAKINIDIANSSTDGLQIRSVRLCNVPLYDNYVTDYSYMDPLDGRVKYLREEPFHDICEPGAKLGDYDAVEWTGLPLTFYMPCNMRGTVDNASPGEKNRFAPNDATYVEIAGESCDGHSILYTYYLGANDTNDFNINPNTVYNYTFNFDGIGDSGVDTRITDYSRRDFDLDANCYMLMIPKSGTATYSFNVVHRPNIFWGDRFGLSSDERYSGNFIGTSDEWHARIIWSDFMMEKKEAEAFLTKRAGCGGGSYMSPEQRVTVNIPSVHPGGNVLIGVYKDDPDTIVWSWHLWISDYDPDAIGGYEPVPGKYIYAVPGGEVHRYGGVAWEEGGRYARSYAMDRYVGAMSMHGSASNEWHREMGYQQGRKDPFCTSNKQKCWTYEDDLSAKEVPVNSYLCGTSESRSNIDRVTGGCNVPWTVNHPNISISGDPWTAKDIFAPSTSTWNDPTCNPQKYIRLENEERGGIENKSFFDPCPPGWRVPDASCYSSFVYGYLSFSSKATNNYKYGHDEFSGATYYPLGKENESQSIFFPAYGLSGDFATTLLYCSNNSGTSRGYVLWMYANGTSNLGCYDGYAKGICSIQPVRCVKE